MSDATLPAVIDIWIHPEGVREAASVFDDPEHQWFVAELARVSGPDLNLLYRASPPFVGVRSVHKLTRAFIGLICPTLNRGEVEKMTLPGSGWVTGCFFYPGHVGMTGGVSGHVEPCAWDHDPRRGRACPAQPGL